MTYGDVRSPIVVGVLNASSDSVITGLLPDDLVYKCEELDLQVVAVRVWEVCGVSISADVRVTEGLHTVCSRGRGARIVRREASVSDMGNTREVATGDILGYNASSSSDCLNDRVVYSKS